MKKLSVVNASECVLCGGRLRNAVFCPTCGQSACSWGCYLRHLTEHAPAQGVLPSYQSDSRRHDGPDPIDSYRPHC